MATKAQIKANRRNAKKSTGPRTTKGKSASSKNAVTHGLLARQDVISSEKQADFDIYREKILKELDPLGSMESMLAERIVSLSWRLIRAGRFQNQTIDTLKARKANGPLTKLTQSLRPLSSFLPQKDPSEFAPELALGRLAITDFTNARVLERLLMYERRIENSLYKTILELQRLNLIRKMNHESKVPFNKLTV